MIDYNEFLRSIYSSVGMMIIIRSGNREGRGANGLNGGVVKHNEALDPRCERDHHA